MSNAWPQVPLGELLTKSEEWISIDPNERYREVTVRLWGKGVTLRRETTGAEITADRRLVVRARQFILSRIDARNGAFGLVPNFLDGAVVSNDFPVFSLNLSRIYPSFLDWMSKTSNFVDVCKAASEGTTNRVRLKEDRFLAMAIPLPPLPEQRCIVARIEELAAKIEEARGLRRQAVEEAKALVLSRLSAEFVALTKRFPVTPLERLTSHILDGPHQTPSYLPDGIPFVTVKNMVTGSLDFSNLNYISEEDHQLFTKRCKPEYGDVLYSKDGATRGRPCFVDTNREFSYFVSVALIKPIRSQLDGHYLVHLLSSNWIKDRMVSKSRGDMIPHIVLKEIRAFPIPHPPLLEQRRIVAYLDDLQAKVDTLKRLQAETSAELDALLPSILDKAFKGEL